MRHKGRSCHLIHARSSDDWFPEGKSHPRPHDLQWKSQIVACSCPIFSLEEPSEVDPNVMGENAHLGHELNWLVHEDCDEKNLDSRSDDA